MTYVPNALNVTEPVESRPVESAALEFRTIKTVAVTNTARITALEDLLPTVVAPTGATVIFVQRLSGDGTQTSFPLSITVLGINAVDVYINGIYQQKNTYTLPSATTIVFSEAPPAGLENIEVKISNAVPSTVQPTFTEQVPIYGLINSSIPDTGSATIELECQYNPAGSYLTVTGYFTDLPPNLSASTLVVIDLPIESTGTVKYVGSGAAAYFNGTSYLFTKPLIIEDGVVEQASNALFLRFGPKNLADAVGTTAVDVYFTATYKTA